MQFKFNINIIFLKTNSFTEQIYSDTAYIINYFFLIFFAMASAVVDSEFFFVHEYFWCQLRTHFVAQVSASVDRRKKRPRISIGFQRYFLGHGCICYNDFNVILLPSVQFDVLLNFYYCDSFSFPSVWFSIDFFSGLIVCWSPEDNIKGVSWVN